MSTNIRELSCILYHNVLQTAPEPAVLRLSARRVPCCLLNGGLRKAVFPALLSFNTRKDQQLLAIIGFELCVSVCVTYPNFLVRIIIVIIIAVVLRLHCVPRQYDLSYSLCSNVLPTGSEDGGGSFIILYTLSLLLALSSKLSRCISSIVAIQLGKVSRNTVLIWCGWKISFFYYQHSSVQIRSRACLRWRQPFAALV